MQRLCSLFLVLFLFRPSVLLGRPDVAEAPGLGGKRPTSTTNQCVDLRPVFKNFGLESRLQGARPTCSVFTVVGAVEFAVAKREGKGPRLSVEFLNWASNQVIGDAADGGFFSDLWKGFERYGICTEANQPYESKFDPSRAPTETALA